MYKYFSIKEIKIIEGKDIDYIVNLAYAKITKNGQNIRLEGMSEKHIIEFNISMKNKFDKKISKLTIDDILYTLNIRKSFFRNKNLEKIINYVKNLNAKIQFSDKVLLNEVSALSSSIEEESLIIKEMVSRQRKIKKGLYELRTVMREIELFVDGRMLLDNSDDFLIKQVERFGEGTENLIMLRELTNKIKEQDKKIMEIMQEKRKVIDKLKIII